MISKHTHQTSSHQTYKRNLRCHKHLALPLLYLFRGATSLLFYSSGEFMGKLFLSLCLCCLSLSSFASAKKVEQKDLKAQIQEYAKEYHLNNALKQIQAKSLLKLQISTDLGLDRERQCDDGHGRPERSDCIDSVCKKIGSYRCDDTSEISEVAQVCARIDDSACIDNVCNRIGSYRCDDLAEINEVSKVCDGIRNSSCIDSVCNRIGSYRCDDLAELQSVSNVCSNIRDVSCIDNVCNRIGSYRCDDLAEIEEVSKACRGR
jgi:hypothetical protein